MGVTSTVPSSAFSSCTLGESRRLVRLHPVPFSSAPWFVLTPVKHSQKGAHSFSRMTMVLLIAFSGLLVPVPPVLPTVFPRNDLVAHDMYTQAQSLLPQQQSRLPQHGASAIFPREWSPPATTLVSEAEGGAEQLDDGSAEAKQRGRLILAAIVCNSVFWQYVLPTLKGEENALGKLLNRDGEGK